MRFGLSRGFKCKQRLTGCSCPEGESNGDSVPETGVRPKSSPAAARAAKGLSTPDEFLRKCSPPGRVDGGRLGEREVLMMGGDSRD